LGELGLGELGAQTARFRFVALAVRAAQAALSLIGLVVLARLLKPEDFGVVAMVVPVVVLTNLMGNGGFQTTLLQSASLSLPATHAFFRFAVRMNLILTAAFTLSSVGLAWFYGEARVIPLAVAWATLLWLLTVTAFQEAMLKRALRFPLVLLIQFIGLAAGVAAGIVAAWLGAGYWALFVQALVIELVRVPWVYRKSEWRPRRSIAGTTATGPSLRRFWGALAGFRLASWVGDQPDRLLVGRIGGAGTLGFYDAAMRWSWYGFTEPFLSLTDIAMTSLARVRHSREQYRRIFVAEARAILTAGLPVSAFAVAEPASVVRVLLGPQWDAAVPFLRVLGVAAFFGALIRLTEWVYFSSGTTDRLLRWWLIVQTPVIVAAVLAGARWGARGVAVGYAAAMTVLAVPSLAWCARGTPLTLATCLRAAARPAGAAIAGALLVLTAAPLLPQSIGASRLVPALAVYAAGFLLAWFVVPGGLAAARSLGGILREVELEVRNQ
jgi:PST family polysaccharide transporter